ncbi:hypothetical protein [Arthrobacter sp. Leaf69]|uniref:hypothetical protein n=1 Tax=Arthrobacter sp. Leaf69 TaxID=1736232 RepID=UPI000700027F|nr:hypothetical protein [Arthrobacter sp. Leaf69]KQN86451.1 hypothetical protein ASE96_12765 [Arthrobacter sp. Leaf69]
MADAPRQDPVSSVSVRELPDRGRVVCRGFIESVTYAPASQVAAFTAVVVDHDAPGNEPQGARTRGAGAVAVPSGSAAGRPATVQTAGGAQNGAVQPGAAQPAGSRRQRPSGPKDRLRVVWLGRRRIPGVDAGTELRLQGMVTVRDGLPTMFNPRYEILSRQEEQ